MMMEADNEKHNSFSGLMCAGANKTKEITVHEQKVMT